MMIDEPQRIRQAIDRCRRRLEHEPHDYDTLTRLGELYLALGERRVAFDHLKRATYGLRGIGALDSAIRLCRRVSQLRADREALWCVPLIGRLAQEQSLLTGSEPSPLAGEPEPVRPPTVNPMVAIPAPEEAHPRPFGSESPTAEGPGRLIQATKDTLPEGIPPLGSLDSPDSHDSHGSSDDATPRISLRLAAARALNEESDETDPAGANRERAATRDGDTVEESRPVDAPHQHHPTRDAQPDATRVTSSRPARIRAERRAPDKAAARPRGRDDPQGARAPTTHTGSGQKRTLERLAEPEFRGLIEMGHPSSAARAPGRPAKPVRSPHEVPLFAALPPTVRDELFGGADRRALERREHVFCQGRDADALYVVLSGSLRVHRDVEREWRLLTDVGPGAFFGEIELFTGDRRRATVTALVRSELLVIPASDVTTLVKRYPKFERALLEISERRLGANYLAANPGFSGLSPTEREALVDALAPIRLSAGEHLYVAGSPPRGIYLVLAGALDRFRDEKRINTYSRGCLMGVVSSIFNQPVTATATARSDTLVLCFDIHELNEFLDSHPDVRQALEEVARLRQDHQR